MKRNVFYISMAACMLLASCSHDDVADSSLPEGKYPLILATGSLPAVGATRATTDGNWDGATTVAVQVAGEVRPYAVTASVGESAATLSSATPFYWHSSSETLAIEAWYPYSAQYPQQWTVKADQSTAADYQAGDLLRGELQLAFADRNDPTKNAITFSHQTAKIDVNLVAAGSVTLGDNAEVRLLNVGGVEGGATTVKLHNNGSLSYSGLLNPQTANAGQRFIQVSAGGNDYFYTPSASRPFERGMAYAYNITVTTSGIEVEEVASATWTADGTEQVASKTRLAEYTASQLKIGDYLYTDGTTSDGGLRALYSDGTFKKIRTSIDILGKNLAGIVFWTASDCDPASPGVADLNADKVRVAEFPLYNHGLAISLREWSGCAFQGQVVSVADFQNNTFTHPNKSLFASVDIGNDIGKILGYQNTQVMLEFNKICAASEVIQPINTLADIELVNPAPTPSTGWYLPSARELHILYCTDASYVNIKRDNEVCDIVGDSMQAAGGIGLSKGSVFWSSSERGSNHIYTHIYTSNYSVPVIIPYVKQTAWIGTRAVCAF